MQSPNGALQFEIEATDAAGNSTIVAVEVEVQNLQGGEGPRLLPRDGACVSGRVRIRVSSDRHDIIDVELQVDGVRIAFGYGHQLSAWYDTTERMDGPMVVRARMHTDAGLIETVHTLRVRNMEMQFARVRGQITGVYTSGGGPVRPEGPNGVNQAVITKDPDGCALEFVFQTQPPLSDSLPPSSNVVGGWASFVVEDLAKSIEFYRDRLGFAINGSGRPAAATLLALEGTPEATATVSTGSRPPGAAYTWFMYDFRGIERKTLQTRLQDPGTAAVSFYVDNVSALLKTLKAGGVRVETKSDEAVMVGGSRRAFVRDPSGILIELVELPADAGTAGR